MSPYGTEESNFVFVIHTRLMRSVQFFDDAALEAEILENEMIVELVNPLADGLICKVRVHFAHCSDFF